MGLVLLLLVLALLFGGVGLFVEGLKWALIIALALFIASFFTGTGTTTSTGVVLNAGSTLPSCC